MVPGTTEERGRGPSWARKYPPLLAMVVAAIIALAILPSALNLPQANPSETLEYAPVPPEDDEPPPPPAAGNLASLGLASSPALNEGPGETGEGGTGAGPGPGDEVALPDLPPPVTLPPSVKTPSTKRCVGSPPRQTEDPLAPPCVASFNADNFGTTYQGVSKEEVRVLFYFDGYVTDLATSQGNESRPRGEYFDLLDAPTEDEHVFIRMLRGYQRYFNDRFQTYDRFVHFYAYYSNNADYTPESRRAEAVDNYAKVKPFSVISYARENAEAYLETMARRGVLNFGSFAGRQSSFFSRYPKLIWGYLPALEVQAKQFSSYVCQKIIPNPVSFSGEAAHMGQPRKLGLLATSDPDRPELHAFRDLVKAEIAACGGQFVIEKAFPRAGYAQDATTPPGYAAENMVAFKDAGVTTVIWAGGLETKQSQAAATLLPGGYRPEWVLAGDRLLESRDNAAQQEQSVWRHALVVSNVTLEGLQDEELCFLAHREADPDAPRGDVIGAACEFYDDLFQLFTGIQVAGPRLGPTSIDKGYHAIPRIASTNPKVPACFYNDNDYTCVKDAVPMFWDPDGRAPGASQNGCWRMPENGKRYLTGTWPAGDAVAQRRPDDVCNSYAAGLLLSFAPPEVG
jgi:hypothetical protein